MRQERRGGEGVTSKEGNSWSDARGATARGHGVQVEGANWEAKYIF